MVMPIEDKNYRRKVFEHKTTMRCKKCGSEFYSRHEGEFRVCQCWNPDGTGGCAIDETRHYCRYIGSDFEIWDDNIAEWIDPVAKLAEAQNT